MGRPRLLLATRVALALQGALVVGAAVLLAVRSTGPGVQERGGAVAGAVLFAVLGAALLGLARALRPPGRAWARTPTVVLELLLASVALIAFQGGRPLLGVPVLASVLLVLAGVLGTARGDLG